METTLYFGPQRQPHPILAEMARIFSNTMPTEIGHYGATWSSTSHGLGATFPCRLRVLPRMLKTAEVELVVVTSTWLGMALQAGSAAPPDASVEVICELLDARLGSIGTRSTVRAQAPTLESANDLHDRALTGELELAYLYPMPDVPTPGSIQRIDLREMSVAERSTTQQLLEARLGGIARKQTLLVDERVEQTLITELLKHRYLSLRMARVQLEESISEAELDSHLAALVATWPSLIYLVRIATGLGQLLKPGD